MSAKLRDLSVFESRRVWTPARRIAAGLTAALLVAAPAVAFGGQTVNGPMGFNPIPGSAYGQTTNAWTEPFIIPEGFSQTKVSDETDLNIYPGSQDDLDDMNTVNETGLQAGRYLYRTHEVSGNGTVSVVDLWGERPAKVLVQEGDFPEFVSGFQLDGLRWTPWGTLLFAEEELEEPDLGTNGVQDRGHLYEIFLDSEDPMVAIDVKDRPMVGRVRHEGIDVAPDGSLYVIDELNGGSLFRFVPDSRGDLSSGQLYALKLTGLTDAEQVWNSGHSHTGDFEWVPLDMTMVVVNANAAADAVHATEYGRPEDVEIIGQTLYIANTTEDRVIAVDLKKMTVSTFVLAGLNVPVENSGASVTGFNNPDNLAEGPDGRVWIVEDNVPSDIWVADKDLDGDGDADNVYHFASMRDSGAEGTGIYFGEDPTTLFVNVQHAAKALADGTWMITRD
jgi:hypothetical protein